MSKKTLLIIGIPVLVIAAVLIFLNYQSNNSNYSTPSFVASSPAPQTPYSLTDVASHPDAKSCWSVINGNVYDLTSWINAHPGGQEAILSICGKDGTTSFTNQHGSNPKQANILASFQIGVLKP